MGTVIVGLKTVKAFIYVEVFPAISCNIMEPYDVALPGRASKFICQGLVKYVAPGVKPVIGVVEIIVPPVDDAIAYWAEASIEHPGDMFGVGTSKKSMFMYHWEFEHE